MGDFAKRLTEVREYRGLSQAELAEKAGMVPSAVSHFETGRRDPSLGSLRKLARALSVSLDDLAGEEREGLGDYRRAQLGKIREVEPLITELHEAAWLAGYRVDEGYFSAMLRLADHAKRGIGRG